MQFELREIMKRATALVLLAIALVAIVHFWSPGDPQPIATPASDNPARRDSSPAPSNNLALEQRPPPTSALSPERPSATAARIELRAPDTVRRGDTFAVTVDLQALRTMRHLEFSVTYKKSILRLLGSSPGSFVQRNGTSVKFEETSDGYLLVRIDPESGVIAGAGSVAVLEFEALKRGLSPLSVHDVTYVEDGGRDATTAPDMQERSITVD